MLKRFSNKITYLKLVCRAETTKYLVIAVVIAVLKCIVIFRMTELYYFLSPIGSSWYTYGYRTRDITGTS